MTANLDIKLDARQRAARTLLQGAAVTVLAAVALAAADVVDGWTGADVGNGASWAALGVAAGTAAVQAVAAWVHAHLVPAIAPGLVGRE